MAEDGSRQHSAKREHRTETASLLVLFDLNKFAVLFAVTCSLLCCRFSASRHQTAIKQCVHCCDAMAYPATSALNAAPRLCHRLCDSCSASANHVHVLPNSNHNLLAKSRFHRLNKYQQTLVWIQLNHSPIRPRCTF